MNLDELDLDTNPFNLPDRVVDAVSESGVTQSIWPVAGDAGRVVLYITEYGIRVYDGISNSLVEWSDTFELQAAAEGLSFRAGRAKELRSFNYLNNVHAVEVQDAIHRAGGNVPRVQHVVTETGPAPLSPEPRRTAARPDPRMTSNRADAEDAKSSLIGIFGLGILVTIVGTFMAVAAYPGTTISDTGEHEDTGNHALSVIGFVLTTAGGFMVFVALVGWGVMLGVRASRANT